MTRDEQIAAWTLIRDTAKANAETRHEVTFDKARAAARREARIEDTRILEAAEAMLRWLGA